MFRHQPCSPIDFYFPMIRGTEKHWHVDYYIAELCEWLQEAFREVQMQSMSKGKRQKEYYDRKANAVSLEIGNLVLVKADAYKGKMKVKDQWEEELYEVECQVIDDIPSCLMTNWWIGHLWVLHWNWLFLITPVKGTPLCMVVWAEWAWCTTTTLEEPTPGRNETEEVPQSVKCLPQAQWQTAETPLGWVNRKLCAVLQTFSGVSLLVQGYKVWCRGTRDWGNQHWCSGGRGIDHTGDALGNGWSW